MTTRPQSDSADELLSKAIQQVAEQSRTLGLHITQHDDIGAARQEYAENAIAEARAALEQAHQTALNAAQDELGAAKADLLSQFAAIADGIRQEAEHHLARLLEEHQQQAAQLEATSVQARAACETLLQTMRDAIASAEQHLAGERDSLRQDYRQATDSLMEEAANGLTRLREQHHRATEAQRRESDDALLRMQEQHQRNAEAQRQLLTQEHQSALETGLDVNRRERDEQRSEYERIRSRTVAELNSELERASATTAAARSEREQQRSDYEQARADTVSEVKTELDQALEASASQYTESLNQATTNLNAEQQRNTDTAIAGINARWARFSRILIGVTAASAAVAVAAIVVALL